MARANEGCLIAKNLHPNLGLGFHDGIAMVGFHVRYLAFLSVLGRVRVVYVP